MPDPTVSVIMAVHNGEQYLRQAVESVLAQPLADLEFIIVDDGSTDRTPAIVAEYAGADSRVVCVPNTVNIGLTRSLNRGLGLARGRYVARQDADDVSLPGRLAAQVEYLETHPGVGLLGTAYVEIDSTDRRGTVYNLPPADTGIRWRMLFHNAFCHTSVMFRRALLDDTLQGYDPRLACAQDYDLWVRLLQRARGANLEEPLVLHRIHNESVTSRRLAEQTRICSEICRRQLAQLIPSINLTSEEVDCLRGWCAQFPRELPREELPLCRKFMQVLRAFETRDGLDAQVLKRIRACWHERVRSAVGESAWEELSNATTAGASDGVT